MILNEDCLEGMRALPDAMFDSIVTDPPYHLTSIVKRFGGENSAPAQHGTDGAFARASRGFMGQQWDGGSAARFFYCAKASKADRGEENTHPTVKPNALMRYLCRLVTPPGGLILDPFAGSGSTGVAALQEGFAFVGFEQSAEYAEIATRRIGEAL